MLADRLRATALDLGFHVQRKVAPATVAKSLARLWPVETDLPLVRLGPDRDGGYLVPDDLDGITACFSPGVDVEAGFELAVAERGIPCFLADASVQAPPVSHPLFDFEGKFLGAVDDGLNTTLASWIARKAQAASGDLLLQMDIEGHEWPVLLSTSDAVLSRFRVIVLELHGMGHMFDTMALAMMDATLQRLGALFHVVHSHPNNLVPALKHDGLEIPAFLEVTLLRKDRAEAKGWASRFPHPLDAPCMPDLPDPPLAAALRGKAG